MVSCLRSRTEFVLRDHLPEEQGLRHDYVTRMKYSCTSQRPSSRRTRIKTSHWRMNSAVFRSQRPSSRRTRIKTPKLKYKESEYQKLRDHLPEEQGLRQSRKDTSLTSRSLRDHLPEEQGLRPLDSRFSLIRFSLLRDHLPEEQGLRHRNEPILGKQLINSETIFQKNKD